MYSACQLAFSHKDLLHTQNISARFILVDIFCECKRSSYEISLCAKEDFMTLKCKKSQKLFDKWSAPCWNKMQLSVKFSLESQKFWVDLQKGSINQRKFLSVSSITWSNKTDRIFSWLRSARNSIKKSWFMYNSDWLKYVFWIFLEEKSFQLFWVLIVQIFRGKSNIIVRESQRNFKKSAKMLIGQ